MMELDRLRVGYGYDLHKLVTSTEGLMVGGIHIPYHKKAHAHSDGDALLHALCDALLGGEGLGDIGQHFPDTDDKWRKIASSQLVSHILRLLKTSRIINIDGTVVLQEPSLAPYKVPIRHNIAKILELPPERINIKATTGEGLDAVGKGDAIAAHCICLLQKGST